MAYETITVDINDHVALITLNRPEALNALNTTLLNDVATALETGDRDEKVRAFVITGMPKAFAAGADITEMADQDFVDVYKAQPFARFDSRVSAIRKPIIAAVSGWALGGGCELAMMCDFIIASETAKFGQPEINLGVIAGIGGTQRLTKLVGKAKAMDMHLTGRTMGAEEAERSGLVARVVPADKHMEEVMEAAKGIASKSLIAASAAKESVNVAENMGLRDGLLFEQRMFAAMFATRDQTEGMHAFKEKRSAQFRDK